LKVRRLRSQELQEFRRGDSLYERVALETPSLKGWSNSELLYSELLSL
jgi:hypothetical protein